ncbi:MAG: biotin/lipoyl-containing protein, partial [Micrococcales bacterium]|nr:biotin/lipoyl-containing protein [Micrococcales bacterium]
MTVQLFRLPDLGEGLTDAVVVQWCVEVGDTVAVDEVVALVETAKASVDVPCPYGGIVTALHGAPGESVQVGAPLVSVEVEAIAAAENHREEEKAGSGNVLIGYGTSDTSSTRRRRSDRGRPRQSRPEPPGPVLTVAFGERVDQPEADRPALVADGSAAPRAPV